MPAKFVRAKNKVHGGIASLPEQSLQFMPDWEPVDGPPPSRPKPKKKPVAAPTASTEQE